MILWQGQIQSHVLSTTSPASLTVVGVCVRGTPSFKGFGWVACPQKALCVSCMGFRALRLFPMLPLTEGHQGGKGPQHLLPSGQLGD